jgi:hypothetical protein
MFVGHFAVGFAAKAVAPKTNVAWFVTASVLADLLFTLFLLVGIEHMRLSPGASAVNPMNFYDYPWSHSLAMDCAWGAVFGGIFWAATRDLRASIVIALAVVSHWVLDAASHIPDMPLVPSNAIKIGLGLWRSLPATLVVEGALWAAGLWLYARTTTPRDAIGRWSYWVFVVFLTALYAGNLFGPPPPNVRIVAWVNLSLIIALGWPAWFDAHRVVKHN